MHVDYDASSHFRAEKDNRMAIKKITVSRNDSFHEGFPDLTMTKTGKLICIYRQSDAHVCTEFTTIVIRISTDSGNTWSRPQKLVESKKKDGSLFKWNCPRIVQLTDGRLLAICDGFYVPGGENLWRNRSVVYFMWSEDDGASWSEPEETSIRGIVPDKLVELPTGAWLIGIAGDSERFGTLRQTVYRSEDKGDSWTGPYIICEHEKYNTCEGSILAINDKKIVCYMRENSKTGLPALKCFSGDDGKNWDGPYSTKIDGCHRPVAGFIEDGRILVTYRYFQGGKMPAKNFFAYLENVSSTLEPEGMKQRGIILPIDHDRSARPDHSYSGWTQLPDGRIFAVSYIVDDAPIAQIRGYCFDVSDF